MNLDLEALGRVLFEAMERYGREHLDLEPSQWPPAEADEAELIRVGAEAVARAVLASPEQVAMRERLEFVEWWLQQLTEYDPYSDFPDICICCLATVDQVTGSIAHYDGCDWVMAKRAAQDGSKADG